MRRRTLLTAAAGSAATALATTGCGPAAHPGPAPATIPPTRSPSPSSPATAQAPADWNALAHSLEGRLVRPGDADYAAARQLYNTRFDSQKPDAVAYVAHEADVQECLAYARTHHTPVSIRSGGHDYAGWSSGTGRLVIDVSRLASVSSDGTIGAGARLLDVYTGLAKNGRTIPGGSCPTVAVSGLTLGGGHGVTARAYGLARDSLTTVDLITADGRKLRASEQQNPDLFWALRGAGNGNFGVVTGLTFRTHDAPRGVTAYLTWPWRQAQAVIGAWQEWGPDQPDEIWSAAHLAGGAGGANPTLTIAAFSLGTYGDLQNALDRLADRAGASASSVSLHRTGFQDAMLLYGGCSTYSQAQCHLPGTTAGRAPQGVLRRETYAAKSDSTPRRCPRPAYADSSAAPRSSPASRRRQRGRRHHRVHRARRRDQPVAPTPPPSPAAPHGCSPSASPPGAPAPRRDPAVLARPHPRRDAPVRLGRGRPDCPDPALTDWRTAYYGSAAPRLAAGRTIDPGRLFDFPRRSDPYRAGWPLPALSVPQLARAGPARTAAEPASGRQIALGRARPLDRAAGRRRTTVRVRRECARSPSRRERRRPRAAGVSSSSATGRAAASTAVPSAKPPTDIGRVWTPMSTRRTLRAGRPQHDQAELVGDEESGTDRHGEDGMVADEGESALPPTRTSSPLWSRKGLGRSTKSRDGDVDQDGDPGGQTAPHDPGDRDDRELQFLRAPHAHQHAARRARGRAGSRTQRRRPRLGRARKGASLAQPLTA